MSTATPAPQRETPLTIDDRIAAIRQTKMAQTADKQRVIGAMDYDDWPLILPPEDRRQITSSVSGSGVEIRDCLLTDVDIEAPDEEGVFFGARLCGRNFRHLLEAHPPYVDPLRTLAGGYMANFFSYRKRGWPADLPVPEDLQARRQRYQLVGAIGASQHFCQDLRIGLELGWRGLQEKVAYYRGEHAAASEDRDAFYDGLDEVVCGMQSWIRHAADEARRLADTEAHPQLRANLLEVAAMNERLVTEPPATFREACQWILWFDLAARCYNGSGSLGRLDELLTPFYEADVAAGRLTDDEALLHLACLLVGDTAYIQLGGPDAAGRDITNRVSYLVLEAAHRLKVPCNVAVAVGDEIDPGLLERAVEILVEDRLGIPKFLGVDRTTEGFARNGVPVEVARTRAYSGCHWSALPGREYTLNDCVKISFGNVFDVALRDMMAGGERSVARLWERFEAHMAEAVLATAESIDFQLRHMKDVFPELVIDLLCHGPIEKGLDASDGFGGAVDYYHMCVDGCALATVADSFAAVEEHVERAGRLTWDELLAQLDADWAGTEGERLRLLMKRIPRYGAGGGRADDWARRVSACFTEAVTSKPTPAGFRMIPGIFSWANTIPLGQALGATPNGRHAGDAISHGANPDPGYRKDGAPTAMAAAIAAVQPGFGNTAPMQLELDPGAVDDATAIDRVCSLIRAHFDLGGTQINLNVLDKQRVLEAHEDPSKHPDLVVRVTGFSAYFASLSPEFRQLVVDRILAES